MVYTMSMDVYGRYDSTLILTYNVAPPQTEVGL